MESPDRKKSISTLLAETDSSLLPVAKEAVMMTVLPEQVNNDPVHGRCRRSRFPAFLDQRNFALQLYLQAHKTMPLAKLL
jgi:hypothetical protein